MFRVSHMFKMLHHIDYLLKSFTALVQRVKRLFMYFLKTDKLDYYFFKFSYFISVKNIPEAHIVQINI